ncbi:MAG: UDP-N-acetylmuramate--L-alanine ligase, partial [Parachlamydiaceae bacterium]
MGDQQIASNSLRGPIHFIGIGGIGMSALARLLLDRGFEVSGSDLSTSYVTEMLEKAGAKLFSGQSADHIPANAIVIYTTGVTDSNPEYHAAQERGHVLLHRSDLLAILTRDFQTLAVAGTHGKTTTSSLLAHVLLSAGHEPAFVIGGLLPQYGTNGRNGSGSCLVIEACESDGTFLKYSPYGGILTNIDADHLDHFGSVEALHTSFFEFLNLIKSPEHFFWCGDDPILSEKSPQGISYGFSEDCLLRLTSFSQEGWKIVFDVQYQGHHYASIEALMVGRHNALNAAAVFGLALTLGVPE